MWCFYHFDFEMCFATQRRTLFRHLNFQNWPEDVVLLVSLGHVLCAATARTCSTSQLPKVARTCGVFTILTWKCASCHNCAHFFISHLPRWLRTCRFMEPSFPPYGATKHLKNTVFRDFSTTFSHTLIFFLLPFSSLASSLLSLSLSASSHLCRFICPCCLKFDFKTSVDYEHVDVPKVVMQCLTVFWL